MITFNIKRVVRHSKKSCRRFLKIIEYITYRPIPKDLTDVDTKNFYYTDWRGHSFLINPERLLYARQEGYTSSELVFYVRLASLRNLAEYRAMGTTTLDLLACKKKEAQINQNRLLRIKDDRVYFIFEEDLTTRRELWH